jgi:hypothetical protein
MDMTSLRQALGPACLMMLASSALHAELPTSTLSDGDLIILRTTADSLKPVLSKDKAAAAALSASGVSPTVTAPARTKFKVNQDDGTTLILAVKDVPCDPDPAPATPTAEKKIPIATQVSQTFSSISVTPADCKEPLVVEGHIYEMNRTDLEKFGYRRLGFIYGGLIIPYKYFAHDKSLEPGTTIGPFLGYRLGQTGWGISLIATYAVTNIKLKVREGTELKDRTFLGLSRGIGFMFDITKSETPFRAGIMWGRDRVGSNNVDDYPHDGRTWVAAQLGWEFGR